MRSYFYPGKKYKVDTLEFRQGCKLEQEIEKMDNLPIILIFSCFLLIANINMLLDTLMLTLVEVGECFIMQFNSRRGRCTQNILKGKDHILIF